MNTDKDLLVTNPLTQLTIDQLRTRTSIKWTTHPADVLPLWVAEMDVPLAQPVAARVHDAIAAGDTGYPSGARTYARAVQSFAADRWDWQDIDIERTAIVPDVMTGIVEVLRLVTGPGDAVVVCPPVYPPFYAFVTHSGRQVIEAPLTPGGRLDADALTTAFTSARQFSEQTVLLLSNPHNPTGTVHTRAELVEIATLARTFGVRVVSDEIHAPVVLPGAQFVPYLSIPGTEDAFALHSASKGWNLSGLKAALLIAGPDAVDDLCRLPEEVRHGPSHVGIIAHTAAFDEGRPWLDALLHGLDTNRTLLADLAAERLPGLALMWPEATYLAWLDCRSLGLHAPPAPGTIPTVSDIAGPAKLFLDEARVALSSGHAYGSGGAGFVRINYATSPTILRDAVDRMAAAASGLETPQRPL
jgi:cystathionine beta-lyase